MVSREAVDEPRSWKVYSSVSVDVTVKAYGRCSRIFCSRGLLQLEDIRGPESRTIDLIAGSCGHPTS